MGRTTSETSNSSRFRIKKVDGGYSIQRNYSYNETQFMGTTKGSFQICDTITAGGNIVWKLLPGTETTELYMAQAHLYRALVSASAYSSELYSKHTDVYNNAASSAAELTASANALDNALALMAKMSTLSWESGDYQMFFEDDPNHVWSYDSDGYIYYGNNKEDGSKSELSSQLLKRLSRLFFFSFQF